MEINQRDVLLIQPLPQTGLNKHPFIVLSILEANQQDDTFVAVMITSSTQTKDDFSFDLTNDMFEQPLDKAGCHVRGHLILSSPNYAVIRKVNTMKATAFKHLMQHLGDLVFNSRFEPLK
jgi:hypothetical protein